MGNIIPKQSSLLVPLLEVTQNLGGRVRPGEIYDRLADAFDLDDETRNATVTIDGKQVKTWPRAVRWTRQNAVLEGHMKNETRGVWELTDSAKVALRNARRGTIVTIFETNKGAMLWANAEDALGVIGRGTCQLIFSSPPYPLTKPKAYGNLGVKEWLSWMLGLAEGWRELLTDDGSLILNVGPVWTKGQPTQDPYIERLIIAMHDSLGFHLAQRLDWHSPTKLPQPIEWVAVKRVRVTPSVEPVLWFSPTPHPKADNRNVLRSYSDSMKKILTNGHDAAVRPSGNVFTEKSFSVDNGGSIPPSLLSIPHAANNDAYHRALKENGNAAHPATFPAPLAEFLIKLTTDRGDLVYDPFAGSGTTAEVCERLDRHWIGSERSRTYIDGARHRFANARLIA